MIHNDFSVNLDKISPRSGEKACGEARGHCGEEQPKHNATLSSEEHLDSLNAEEIRLALVAAAAVPELEPCVISHLAAQL